MRESHRERRSLASLPIMRTKSILSPRHHPPATRELVVLLARENSWGDPRILGELRKLGITYISRQTVKAILKEHHIAPAPDRGGGAWAEFSRVHAATLWQCEFLTKPNWTPKGLVNLDVLVFIQIGTRRIWLSPATRPPDAAWVTDQAEGFLADAEAAHLPATIMVRDNDVKYPPGFDAILQSAGLEVPKMPVQEESKASGQE